MCVAYKIVFMILQEKFGNPCFQKMRAAYSRPVGPRKDLKLRVERVGKGNGGGGGGLNQSK